MKKYLSFTNILTSASERLSRVLTVIFLLAVSILTFADNYYLWYKNSNDPQTGTMTSAGQMTQSGTVNTYTINSFSGDYCFFITASNSGTESTAYSSMISGENITRGKYSLERGQYAGRSMFHIYSNVSVAGVTICYDSSTGNLSAVDPKWVLCGEFTDWDPEFAPELIGSGSTVSTQIYLPYNATYANQTDKKGFKIVCTASGSSTWYGNQGQMNYDTDEHHTNWLFENQNGYTYNCGLKTHWSGYHTFTFDTSSKKLTVTYPTAVYSTPIAYWGEEPTKVNSATYTSPQREDIKASAYIASQGCSGGSAQDVTKIRVRFWKKGDSANTDVVELEKASAPYFEINKAYDITIPCDREILVNALRSDDKIVMEVGAYNAKGWSAYSDQMEIPYRAPKAFIVNNLGESPATITFTACDGNHQFLLKDMVMPSPDSWTLEKWDGSGYVAVTASEHFTLKDGYMVWNNSGKAAGDYKYRFSFDKSVEGEAFPIASATIEFNYDADPLTYDITSLTVTAGDNPTKPWEEVTLTASYPSEKDFTSLEWSVDKTGGYNLVSSAFGSTSTTAVFKGSTLFESTDYNIAVKGKRSTDCVTTAGKSVKVTVEKDEKDCTQAAEVLRAADPVVAVGPRVTLNGYLKYRGRSGSCVADYTTYGFCYSTNSTLISGTTDLNVSGVTYKSKTGAALTEDNRNWDYTISDGLTANTTYYYKAYTVGANGDSKVFSDMGSFTTGEACKHPVGDPINYYIDDDYDENDPCDLMFTNIADALANLKSHMGVDNDDWWDDSNDMLKVNVVFNVYPGTYGVSKTTSIDVSGINRYKSTTTPTKRLTIVGTDATNKPVIYGLNLADSRFITLKYLNIVRETTGTGLTESSIVIGVADQNNNRTVGELTNSGLEFIKCDINAQAFCCIHANGVNGLYMTGCNLTAKKNPSSSDVMNDMNWGASIKFMNCKNIKMLRNNFRGSHGTNIFFQNSRDALIMNNVFWNDNEVKRESEDSWNYKAFVRLIKYGTSDAGHNIANVGMYYNTMYLKNNTASGYNDNTDFLVLGGQADTGVTGKTPQTHTAADYDFSTIDFMYNNCYSYDADIPGKTSTAFCSQDISSSTHITHNNFWSANGSADFSFGNDTHNVDMSLGGGMMCSTAPYDPDGLVIKGSFLNLGSKISTDISGQGGDNIYDDRLRDAVRPASGSGWTYGAYQQTLGVDLHEIYWRGTENTDWSNRNNWYKLVNGEYQLVTCVDVLSNDLKAVILEQTGDDKKYPIIPEWEDTHEGYNDEGVYTASTNQFAKTIDVQYGASILGVENLKESDGTYRYFEGINHLDADRKEWLMVGTVICPFKDYAKAVAGTDSTSRLIISNDFFRDHLPHVYMQQFEYDGEDINYDAPFTQLDESVPYDKCFTIFCADQYGPKKRTAAMYYGDASKGSEPIKYEFKGRYAAEKLTGKPVYEFTGGKQYFVNNYYPANVDVQAFNNASNTVQYYDVKTGGWNPVVPATERDVTPQSGVFVDASADNSVDLDGHFTTNSTKYKSASVNQGLTLFAYSTATGKGSNAGAWQDYKNITKAENVSDPDVCELYILHGGVNLSALSYQFADTVIALGVNNKLSTSMSVKFELLESYLLDEIYLEDRAADPVVRYDLMSGEKPYFANLPSGRTEGRFYLVIGDGQSTEPDVPTEVPAEKALNFNIDAFVNNSVLTVSVGADATISSITMYDMAGRAYTVPVNGKNFSQSELTVAKGIYTVTVVTDRGTETKKVVVK